MREQPPDAILAKAADQRVGERGALLPGTERERRDAVREVQRQLCAFR